VREIKKKKRKKKRREINKFLHAILEGYYDSIPTDQVYLYIITYVRAFKKQKTENKVVDIYKHNQIPYLVKYRKTCHFWRKKVKHEFFLASLLAR